MSFYAVYAADVEDAARALAHRVWRRKSGAIWFGLLFAGTVWLALRLAEISLTVELPPSLQVTPGTLLFLAFFGMLAKGAVDAYHRAIRPESLVFLLAQPMRRESVALGKFFTVLWTNLAFLAGALALATVFVASGMDVPLPWEFGAGLVLAVVAGLASGFALAVLGSLSTWRRKAAGLASYAPVIGLAYVALLAANPTVRDAFLAVAVLLPLSLLGVLGSARFLLEAWNNQTAGRRRVGEPRSYVRLPDPQMDALVNLELKTMVRKRQVLLSLATTVVVGIALVSTYAVVGPPVGLDPRFASLFYPIIVAAGVYVVAATQLTVPGMAALGKELDRLWILKSHPVPGRTVYSAKAAAILFLAPSLLVAVALPLPLVAGFRWEVVAYLLATSVAVTFGLVALGLYVGGRSPNFDPNTQGLPDSIAMYNVFLAALFVAFVLFAALVPLYQADRALGILGAILVADLAALSVVIVSVGATRRYDLLEA